MNALCIDMLSRTERLYDFNGKGEKQAESKLMPRQTWQGKKGMVDYQMEIQGDLRPCVTCEQMPPALLM